MTSIRRGAWVVALLLAAVRGAPAQRNPQLNATLERVGDNEGDSLVAYRVAISMDKGWHIGAPKPGVTGLPTEILWRLPDGWTVVHERWPAPQRERVGRDTAFTYSGSLTVLAHMKQMGKSRRPIRALLTYGICREVCVPGRVLLTSDR